MKGDMRIHERSDSGELSRGGKIAVVLGEIGIVLALIGMFLVVMLMAGENEPHTTSDVYIEELRNR